MKFKCDKTYDEKRADWSKLVTWRKWFAWYPVKVADGDCRWLEYVLFRYDTPFDWYLMVGLLGSKSGYRAI
jgi:hypothetical protein